MDFKERYLLQLRLAILLHLKQRPEIENRRLIILRILIQAPGLMANASFLQDCLADAGHHPTRDQVRGDLAWLQEQGVVKVTVHQGVTSAQALTRAQDIAEGRIEHPGIAPLMDATLIKAQLKGVGLSPSADDVNTTFAWLSERKLLLPCVFGDTVVITDAGRDVAEGRTKIDGIKAASGDTLMRTAAQSIIAELGD